MIKIMTTVSLLLLIVAIDSVAILARNDYRGFLNAIPELFSLTYGMWKPLVLGFPILGMSIILLISSFVFIILKAIALSFKVVKSVTFLVKNK